MNWMHDDHCVTRDGWGGRCNCSLEHRIKRLELFFENSETFRVLCENLHDNFYRVTNENSDFVKSHVDKLLAIFWPHVMRRTGLLDGEIKGVDAKLKKLQDKRDALTKDRDDYLKSVTEGGKESDITHPHHWTSPLNRYVDWVRNSLGHGLAWENIVHSLNQEDAFQTTPLTVEHVIKWWMERDEDAQIIQKKLLSNADFIKESVFTGVTFNELATALGNGITAEQVEFFYNEGPVQTAS